MAFKGLLQNDTDKTVVIKNTPILKQFHAILNLN